MALPSGKRWLSATVVMGWLLSVCSAEANPGDQISLSASGLMSPGLEISINLETGDALKRSTRFGSHQPGEQFIWQEARRRLSPDELRALKKVIKTSLAGGLRSKACDDEDRQAHEQGRIRAIRPIIADSIIFLSVQLDGQHGYAPERVCTSPAFDALWSATYSAASAGAP